MPRAAEQSSGRETRCTRKHRVTRDEPGRTGSNHARGADRCRGRSQPLAGCQPARRLCPACVPDVRAHRAALGGRGCRPAGTGHRHGRSHVPVHRCRPARPAGPPRPGDRAGQPRVTARGRASSAGPAPPGPDRHRHSPRRGRLRGGLRPVHHRLDHGAQRRVRALGRRPGHVRRRTHPSPRRPARARRGAPSRGGGREARRRAGRRPARGDPQRHARGRGEDHQRAPGRGRAIAADRRVLRARLRALDRRYMAGGARGRRGSSPGPLPTSRPRSPRSAPRRPRWC